MQKKTLQQKGMIYIYHCKTIEVQHFKKTQYLSKTTWSKSFQEYNMKGNCNKEIKHNLKIACKSTILGFDASQKKA